MSNRLNAFYSLRECPVHRSAMNKLKKDELRACEQFILDNDHLDKASFAAKVNMWYVGDNNKPKNHTTMWAMVTSANSKGA